MKPALASSGMAMLPTPPDEGEAVRIDVRGHQWWFEVSYPGTDITLEDQMFIPAWSDHAAQPQTRSRHDRHGQPERLPLRLDPQFIGLHMLQISRRKRQVLMHLLAMQTCAFLPLQHCSLVYFVGRHACL